MGGTALHQFVSPLRYPGGKRKLANFLKMVFIKNDLVGSDYVEAYAGGASVALSLLFEEYASQIHINDLNRSVAAFWRVALSDPDSLCKRISSVRVSMNQWKEQKAVQEAPDPEDADLAFSTFFLNRTDRSGIIGGGVIGGKRQTGSWKLDARFNKADLIRRIERISRFSGRIVFTSLDAAEYLRTRLPQIGRAFAYLDPPYYSKGLGLYENSYKAEDHVEIAHLVKSLRGGWIVSYDDHLAVRRLYAAYRRRIYSLSYSAGARYSGSEVMFFSPDLTIPRVHSPAHVSPQKVERLRVGQGST